MLLGAHSVRTEHEGESQETAGSGSWELGKGVWETRGSCDWCWTRTDEDTRYIAYPVESIIGTKMLLSLKIIHECTIIIV